MRRCAIVIFALMLTAGGRAQRRSPTTIMRFIAPAAIRRKASVRNSGASRRSKASSAIWCVRKKARLYFVNVPGIVNSGLDSKDTAALLNWVVKIYGGKSTPESWTPFDGAEIEALRRQAPPDIMAYRKQVQDRLNADGYSIGTYP